MVHKLMIVVLLGLALYMHNLGMFFGMIVAYIVGSMSMIDTAVRYLTDANEMMNKIKKLIEEEKKNG